MVVTSLIERKRDGGRLSVQEWAGLVEGYAAGRIPDYQIAALLMAVVWRGLTPEELLALTGAMLASGDRLDFGDWPKPRVDKHSTGGVGDKTSLILVPLVASCGVAVPMISGAGLGRPNGTSVAAPRNGDHLELCPGQRTADLVCGRAQLPG